MLEMRKIELPSMIDCYGNNGNLFGWSEQRIILIRIMFVAVYDLFKITKIRSVHKRTTDHF